MAWGRRCQGHRHRQGGDCRRRTCHRNVPPARGTSQDGKVHGRCSQSLRESVLLRHEVELLGDHGSEVDAIVRREKISVQDDVGDLMPELLTKIFELRLSDLHRTRLEPTNLLDNVGRLPDLTTHGVRPVGTRPIVVSVWEALVPALSTLNVDSPNRFKIYGSLLVTMCLNIHVSSQVCGGWWTILGGNRPPPSTD